MKFEGTQVNIPIKGIMRAGTDNLCADGAMNEVIGMEYKDGSWLPYKMSSKWPSVPANLGGRYVVKAYVHKTSDGNSHYVFITRSGTSGDFGEQSLWYQTGIESGTYRITATKLLDDVKDVEFVGNVLCVATNTDLKYYLWKSGSYVEWGAPLEPCKEVAIRVTAGFEYDGNLLAGIKYGTIFKETSASTTPNESLITEHSETIISNTIAALRELHDRGALAGYALGCIAYRLTNGDLVCASAPVLLGKPLDVYASKSDGAREVFFSGTNILSEDFGRVDSGTKKIYSVFPPGTGARNRGEAYVVFDSAVIDTTIVSDYYNIYKTEGVRELKNVSGERCGFGIDSVLTLQCIDSTPGSLTRGNPIVQSRDVYVPQILTTVITDKSINSSGEREWNFSSYVAGNGLQYKVLDVERLRDLKDIGVASVCFCISDEVLPFVYKDKLEDFDKMYLQSYGLFEIWQPDNTSKTQEMGCSNSVIRKDSEKIIKELSEVNSFYIVGEKSIDDILENSDWEYLDLSGKLSDNLSVQEQLPLTAFDILNSTPNCIGSYNYRLHQYDYAQELFKGHPYSSFAHYGGLGQYASPAISEERQWEIKVEISGGLGDSKVVNYSPSAVTNLLSGLTPILSYPGLDAKTMTFRFYINEESSYREKSFILKPIERLGISAYFDPDLKPINPGGWPATALFPAIPAFEEENSIRKYENGLKVSDVAYPSYFPAAYTYRIGNERIIGIARLTMPVSQDNYGSYSLVVFCTDGIYTMGVDKTGNGVYTDIAYFSPEVCIDRKTICEIGGGIVFASDKGLMLLTSNGVEEFVPQLNGDPHFLPANPYVPTTSPKDGQHIYYKAISESDIVQLDSAVSHTDFISYLQNTTNSGVSYVSKKGKIIVYNHAGYSYCYLIDIATRNVTKLKETVYFDDDNSPEETYWVSQGGDYKALGFGYLSAEGVTDCLIQSRPIKVQQDDKCSYRVVITGYFEGEQDKWAELIVLGSLDAEHWRPIGIKEKKLQGGFHNLGCITDRGSWKYLMFIFAGQLSDKSHIDSIDITAEGKYNNKKR